MMGAAPAPKPGEPPTVEQKKQLPKLLFLTISRWLMTAAIVGAMYGVLVHYYKLEAMTSAQKREFNALIVSLTISLSLNIVASLKAMAGELRWWVLSLRDWPIMEADLILQAEYMSELMKLALISRIWRARFLALFWIFINVAAQVAVATFSLTYSIESAGYISPRKHGMVSIADLQTLQTTKVLSSPSQTLSAKRYTANTYGTIAEAFDQGTLDNILPPGWIPDVEDPFIYCGDTQCKYLFYESTVPGSKHAITVATNRTVTTTVDCESYKVVKGGDGTSSSITILEGDSDDSARTRIPIPAKNGDLQTTFMVNSSTDLGEHEALISAFEASKTDPWYYRCSVDIGKVQNAQIPEHYLGVNVTNLAAAAIALQGYGSAQYGNSADTETQFQSYPAESTYGEPKGGKTNRDDGMSKLIASFATGVVGVTTMANSRITAPGLMPVRGVELSIPHWSYVHAVLLTIASLHLVMGVLSTSLANTVTFRGHSMMAMADLLRPISQAMSYRCDHIEGKNHVYLHEPDPTLRYRPTRKGLYTLQTNFGLVSPFE